MVRYINIFGFEDYKRTQLVQVPNSSFYQLHIKELSGYFFIVNFTEIVLDIVYPEQIKTENLFFILQKKNKTYSVNTLAPLYLENNTLSQLLFPEIRGVTLLAPFILKEKNQYQESAELY